MRLNKKEKLSACSETAKIDEHFIHCPNDDFTCCGCVEPVKGWVDLLQCNECLTYYTLSGPYIPPEYIIESRHKEAMDFYGSL